jgi:stringent starvation protein B
MSSGDNTRRVQELVATLLEKRLVASLAQVEDALAAWRRGETGSSEAHAETLRHTQRAQVLGARVARAGVEGPLALLRDAFSLGLVDEAEFTALTGKAPADVPPPPPLDDDDDDHASAALPPKRDVLDKLLQDGPVLLHIDARFAGVDVPDQHRRDARLILRIGYGLTPAIPDLGFDDHGARATLTFRGKPFACRIPWGAIYAVVAEDGRGLVWPDDVPDDVAEQLERELRGQKSGAGSGAQSASGRVGPARAPSSPPSVAAAGASGGASDADAAPEGQAGQATGPGGGASAGPSAGTPASGGGDPSPDKPKRGHLRLV